MNASDVITLGQDALLMGALIAGPLLLGLLGAGVLIGIVQAATSVQEMTLSFIPKLIILVLLLFFIGNWQISVLVEHFQTLLMNIPIYLQ